MKNNQKNNLNIFIAIIENTTIDDYQPYHPPEDKTDTLKL